MNNFTPHIYTFILPLFVGNIMHMVIVKRNYFPLLAVPLSVPLFGTGKTYRAFLVMPLICGLTSLVLRAAILQELDYGWSFAIGFILGAVYLLAELPNSYIKRRLGILPGRSGSRYRHLQYVIDKVDSLLPLCIVYFFITGITVSMAATIFAVSFTIHVAFSWLLFQLKIKKSF